MTTNTEVWSYIPGTLDYQISSNGRVRRINAPDVMRIGRHKGYARVKLHIRTQPYYFYVHRLVAKVFMPGFLETDGLSFIDGDKTNVRLDNLEIKGRVKRNTPKDLRIQVVETGGLYPTIAAAARAVGGQGPNVNRVLKGTLKTHKGFTFRYVKV